ncbi:unnamed protein product, partial [Mesorhabditis belari]|uniref:C6 domain-containing protein n=1 Tax=Mesorhabditis belari TaxID=2138241 RepID=A0AAF3J4I5_9BILA
MIFYTLPIFLGFLTISAADCPACPSGGVWTAWQTVSSCTAPCGGCGWMVQKRTCSSRRWGCPCDGPYSRKRQCPTTPCPGPSEPCCAAAPLKNGQCIAPLPNPAPYNVTCAQNADICWCPEGTTQSGIWSAWSNVGTCTKTCGLCGTIKQTRTCLSEAWGCPCNALPTQTKDCPITPCPASAASACCKSYTVLTNTGGSTNSSTWKQVCGITLPDDPTYPNNCHCTDCTAAKITKVPAGGKYSAFTSAGVTSTPFTSCPNVYKASCMAGDGKQASIELNGGTLPSVSGTPSVELDLTCASNGSGWEYNGKIITKIGCLIG